MKPIRVDPGVIVNTARRVAATMSLPRTVDRDDISQEAALGFLDALTRYDPSRGFRPQTLGERRARGAVLDYLRRADPCGRGLRKKVKAGLADGIVVVSLSEWDCQTIPVSGTKSADELATGALLEQRVEAALATLKGRDQEIIRMLFWGNLSSREAGKRLRLSEGRICQLRKRALAALKPRLVARHILESTR
jgi:RNA polymerase sigma factor for flagellar operon FliA